MTPKPAPITTILFDLDGTLTDSAPGILGSFLQALAEIGEPQPGAEVLRNVLGPSILQTPL